MPEAVIYQYLAKTRSVYFAHSNALLPVKLNNGEVRLVTWGRRQHESGELPLGGWARLDSIHQGRWSPYFPKPILLPLQKFMKTDYENRNHWFEVVKGQHIQGLLAREGEIYRVYIVTIVPAFLDSAYDRWPRIVVKSSYLQSEV